MLDPVHETFIGACDVRGMFWAQLSGTETKCK